jgi:hypothetical protein
VLPSQVLSGLASPRVADWWLCDSLLVQLIQAPGQGEGGTFQIYSVLASWCDAVLLTVQRTVCADRKKGTVLWPESSLLPNDPNPVNTSPNLDHTIPKNGRKGREERARKEWGQQFSG